MCGAGAYHGRVPTSAALRLWAPVVLWAAVIFALSAVPDLGTGLGTWDLVLRKLAHACEFALLGALLMRALRDERAAFAAGASATRRSTERAKSLRSTNPPSARGSSRGARQVF